MKITISTLENKTILSFKIEVVQVVSFSNDKVGVDFYVMYMQLEKMLYKTPA